MTKDIICLWTGEGSRFHVDYVHILKSMIDRHTTREHRFFCLSPKEIKGIDTIPLEDKDFGTKVLEPRGWNMVYLFNGYPQLSSKLVYFDLDTIIVDNIDAILGYDGDFAVLEDLGAKRPMFGGALMIWDQNKFTWLADEFGGDTTIGNVNNRKRADVWYGNKILHNDYHVDWLQDLHKDQLHSYKISLKKGDLLPDTKIVFFHGVPMPHEVDNEWVRKHWR